jgi:hypothetical protein
MHRKAKGVHYRFYSPLQLRKFFKNNIKFFGDKRVTGLSRPEETDLEGVTQEIFVKFRGIFQCCGSGMIYSGPGTDLRFISGSAPKLDRVKKEVNYLNF